MCRDLRHIAQHIKARHHVLTATHFLQQDHDTFCTTHATHFSLVLLKKHISNFFFNLILLNYFILFNYSYSENSSGLDPGICPISSWSDLHQTASEQSSLDHRGSRLAFSRPKNDREIFQKKKEYRENSFFIRSTTLFIYCYVRIKKR